MGLYQIALFVTLAFVLQPQHLLASDCKRRSTFIQIRIPQRTNVAVKYPKEINSVEFVPFPYNLAGSECVKCKEASCHKCTYTKKSHSVPMDDARRTNIIIDIKGTRHLNETLSQSNSKINDSSSATVDGTIVAIYDKTTAVSKSGAKAQAGKAGQSAAAIASGTALSQSDVLAAVNDVVVNKANGQKTSVEDIYVASEGLSTANANSSAASDDSTNSESSKSSHDETTNSTDNSNGASDKNENTAAIPLSPSTAISPSNIASTESEQLSLAKSSDSSAVTTTETIVEKKETSLDTSSSAKTNVNN